LVQNKIYGTIVVKKTNFKNSLSNHLFHSITKGIEESVVHVKDLPPGMGKKSDQRRIVPE